MAYNYTELQILRGDSSSNAAFVGKAGMLVADMESSAQVNVGTLRLHDGTTPGGFVFGYHAYSSSYADTALSSSYAATASYALDGKGFPFSGSAIITGSLLVSQSGIMVTGSLVVTDNVIVGGTLTAQEFYTEFVTASVIYESGSTKFGNSLDDTHQFTGSVLITGSITGRLFGTSSWSDYAATASYVSGGISIQNGLIITGSLTVVSGSITGSITGSLFGTASSAISSSYALTSSYAVNAGAGAGFPFSGSAVITGSLLITGSGLRVTGSADIIGNFTATTKSFKIQHQRKPGKHLVYGVLEGPEHSVFVRGKLENNNVIVLPNEWEWLVDVNTITVHLTPIGKQQRLYVKQIDGLYITVENGSWFAGDVCCYYTVYATRKDTVPLETIV